MQADPLRGVCLTNHIVLAEYDTRYRTIPARIRGLASYAGWAKLICEPEINRVSKPKPNGDSRGLSFRGRGPTRPGPAGAGRLFTGNLHGPSTKLTPCCAGAAGTTDEAKAERFT